MADRLRKLGFAIAAIGVVFIIGGIYALTQVQTGYKSLDAFSAAQNVTINYNDDGQLVDRGDTEAADEILKMLEDEWGFAVKESELDPDDPVMDTATEYMYQMAVIAHHVMYGTQTIVLDEAVEYEGETFPKGEHEFEVNGRYWTDFDRMHPLEGPARAQAWTGTAHALIAELGVGAVTASALQLGLALSLLVLGLGLTFALIGGGLVWATPNTVA